MRKGTFRRILCGLLAVLCAVIFFVPDVKANAESTPLDEIEKYQITISVNDKGELLADYLITWKVLDDQREGPLTWVKVLLPSGAIHDLVPTTDNVASASSYQTDQEQLARIDLDRAYYAGETVTFGFSCRIYQVYYPADDGYYATYFNSGWFDGIAVDEYEIRWDSNEVSYAYPEYEEIGGYYVWKGSLRPGDQASVHIEYPETTSAIKYYRRHGFFVKIAIFSVFTFLITAKVGITLLQLFTGSYVSMRGGRQYHSRGFGGRCACACACACAGGGRAGCSAKDFYGTKVSSARVRARLRAKCSSES